MKYTWWIFQIIGTLVSIFFFLFGLDLIIGAYTLKDPFSFIMTFFAASFIITISLALMVTFPVKMIRVFKYLNNPEHKNEL